METEWWANCTCTRSFSKITLVFCFTFFHNIRLHNKTCTEAEKNAHVADIKTRRRLVSPVRSIHYPSMVRAMELSGKNTNLFGIMESVRNNFSQEHFISWYTAFWINQQWDPSRIRVLKTLRFSSLRV